MNAGERVLTSQVFVGAIVAIAIALSAMFVSDRIGHARTTSAANTQPESASAVLPHPVMSTIGAGLLSGFVLLTGFLVASGWAVKSTHDIPPTGLYVAGCIAGVAVLLYPALADISHSAYAEGEAVSRSRRAGHRRAGVLGSGAGVMALADVIVVGPDTAGNRRPSSPMRQTPDSGDSSTFTR